MARTRADAVVGINVPVLESIFGRIRELIRSERGIAVPTALLVLVVSFGFATVGAFDSLLDVPRVGFVFFTLLLLGLGLRALPGEGVARVA